MAHIGRISLRIQYLLADANTTQTSVYPNPTSNLITIESDGQIDYYQVHSFDGRLVQSGSLPGSKTIEVSDLQGIYNLTLTFEDGSVWNDRVVVE